MEEIKINIEEIIKEIREDIKKKGYKETDLSFNDIPIPDKVENIEKDELKKSLDYLNANWCHNADLPFDSSNSIAKIIKRLIRKFVRFLFYPVLVLQNNINSNIVNSLNVMTERSAVLNDQNARKFEELNKKIAELENELNEIKNKG